MSHLSDRDFETLVGQDAIPRVYRMEASVRAEMIKVIAATHNYSYFYLDGSNVTDHESFTDAITQLFAFPTTGDSWDGIKDWLDDLAWLHLTSKGVIFHYNHFDNFMLRQPDQFQIALDVFESSIMFWRIRKRQSFYILLQSVVELPSLIPVIYRH